MDDIEQRLHNCFEGVFPELSAKDIPKASVRTVGSWDSTATITLVSVVEEEYDVRFAPEEIDSLTSYESILRQVRLAKAGRGES